MRILMISPYPPARDGIASYAMQSVARLRAEGNDVEVLSPYASAAHHHLNLRGSRGALALARLVRGYDRVIVQFHPDMFFNVPHTLAQRARAAAALGFAWRQAKDLEVRVHEADYSWGRGPGMAALAVRGMWRAVPRLVVHTETERQKFHEAFGVPLAHLHVAAHGADLTPRTHAGRAEARSRLQIPERDLMFLCIGFIQQHKGFDRAVEAFGKLGAAGGRGARLDIVGSVRLEDPGQLRYAERLSTLVAQTPGVELHEGFLSEEAFDLWIVASDVVVLPYRHIWSSGVMERAGLYARPVIAARVGGLADQARPGSAIVDDDSQLADAMRRFAHERGLFSQLREAEVPWPAEALHDRISVMSEVRARATVARGSGVARGRAPVADGALAAPRRRSGESYRRTAPLRRIPTLSLPPPVSSRPGITPIKRTVQRLTAWEIDPVVDHLNQVHRAIVEVLELLSDERLPGAAGSGGVEKAPAEDAKPQRRRSRPPRVPRISQQ